MAKTNPKAAPADPDIAQKHRDAVHAKVAAQAADQKAAEATLAQAAKKGGKRPDNACQATTGTAEQQNPNRRPAG